jgi:hypothetical protein
MDKNYTLENTLETTKAEMAALAAQNKHLMEQLSQMTTNGLTREEPYEEEDIMMANLWPTSDSPHQDNDAMDKGDVVDGVAPTEAPVRVVGGDRRDGEDSLVMLRGGGDSGHTGGSRSPISSHTRFKVFVNDTVYSRVDQGADYIATPNTYRGDLSPSESSEDEELPGAGGAAPTGGPGLGMEHATLTQSHRHRLMTALPPYTNTALGVPQGISTSPLAYMALAESVKGFEPAPAVGQADDTGEGRGGPQ